MHRSATGLLIALASAMGKFIKQVRIDHDALLLDVSSGNEPWWSEELDQAERFCSDLRILMPHGMMMTWDSIIDVYASIMKCSHTCIRDGMTDHQNIRFGHSININILDFAARYGIPYGL